MNRIFLILLLLLPFVGIGQTTPIPKLNRSILCEDGSYTKHELRTWRFHRGDSASMATPGYDDSKWEQKPSALYISPAATKALYDTFSSIGWFRYRFIADSSVVDSPLVLMLTHRGASEIYFDGKEIKSFGVINGPQHSRYYDPQYVPFSFIIPATGEHVIAVRYANFNAKHNFNTYRNTFSGFRMQIGFADAMIADAVIRTDRDTFYPILFSTVFLTLSILHLLLFLFYRTIRSNIFFSLFCFSLSLGFYFYYLNNCSSDPSVANYTIYCSILLFILLCYSLSGFSNELFSKRKLRFRIITAVCLLGPIVFLIDNDTGSIVFLALLIGVMVECIILTLRALYKRVKGARIIGVGTLFFTIFIVVLICLAMFKKDGLSFNTERSADIFMYTLACALLSLPISMSVYLSWTVANNNKDLKRHLQHVEELSKKALEQEQEKKQLLETQNERLEREVSARTSEVVAQKDKIEKQNSELKAEKKKSDDLLLNILPEEVAEELKQNGKSVAKFFDDVTVLFTDFVDFTKVAEDMTPQELVDELDVCFKAFDDIISKYGIEKIKTIGDAYLAVCGLPLPDDVHAEKVATASIEIAQFMMLRKQQLGAKTFDVRIGIHSGNLVAGIVGVKKFAYDIWGDTVNTAARMEQNSQPGKINISQTTYDLIKDKFECTYRGEITAKNKGELKMYFIEKPKTE